MRADKARQTGGFAEAKLSELDKIIEDLAGINREQERRIIGNYTTETIKSATVATDAAKNEAASLIQAWALDIVGEDEPRHFDYVDGGDVEIAGAFIRNQLRQELRDRIKGESK